MMGTAVERESWQDWMPVDYLAHLRPLIAGEDAIVEYGVNDITLQSPHHPRFMIAGLSTAKTNPLAQYLARLPPARVWPQRVPLFTVTSRAGAIENQNALSGREAGDMGIAARGAPTGNQRTT